jgi:hypothetical protein
MEALVIIVAFWLILIGIYGALPLLKRDASYRAAAPVAQPRRAAPPARRYDAQRYAALKGRNQPAPGAPAGLPGVISEVDLLRAQVDQLRDELFAFSGGPDVRSRTRRPRAGVSANLPRDLKRHVQEVRSSRRAYA